MKKHLIVIGTVVLLLVVGLSGCVEQSKQDGHNENVKQIITVGINGDYLTIQQAINVAKSGDTIQVHPKTYNENIVINKQITLNGSGFEDTIIDGGKNGNVIEITSDGVVLSNFTVRNSDVDDEDRSGIYLKKTSYCTIENNKLSSNFWGIYLEDESNNNQITGNIISDNKIGINVKDDVTDAVIEYNTVSNNNRIGIIIEQSSKYNTIRNNTISSNTYDGISLGWYCDGNTITDNTISDNMKGIYIFNSKSNTITGNEIKSNSNYGIFLQTANNSVVTQNTLSDNMLLGIYLKRYSSYNHITNNTISTNNFEYGGISYDDTCVDNVIKDINYQP